MFPTVQMQRLRAFAGATALAEGHAEGLSALMHKDFRWTAHDASFRRYSDATSRRTAPASPHGRTRCGLGEPSRIAGGRLDVGHRVTLTI